VPVINIAASALVFVFTTVLTIAGVGSAFIVIPTFYWLGVPLTEAMAIGLLLNAISMTFASANYIRYNLVLFRTAVPIILLAVVFSPLGAYSTKYFPKEFLILLFVLFLVFAASMMLFYKPKKKADGQGDGGKELTTGIGLGIGAGYLGGLLGVGGGNFIVPALVWLGLYRHLLVALGLLRPCSHGVHQLEPADIRVRRISGRGARRLVAHAQET